jgi:hypothetical protein
MSIEEIATLKLSNFYQRKLDDLEELLENKNEIETAYDAWSMVITRLGPESLNPTDLTRVNNQSERIDYETSIVEHFYEQEPKNEYYELARNVCKSYFDVVRNVRKDIVDLSANNEDGEFLVPPRACKFEV